MKQNHQRDQMEKMIKFFFLPLLLLLLHCGIGLVQTQNLLTVNTPYLPSPNLTILSWSSWSSTSVAPSSSSVNPGNLILVPEKVTWQEALDYCRSNYIDLACITSQSQVFYLDMLPQTGSVWTGLRFRDGHWFWLNREPVGSDITLPSCPARPYRCGARNIRTKIWENRACDEKLNFCCFRG